MVLDKKDQGPLQETQRVLVKMTSRNAKAIEKVVSDLLSRANDESVTVRGPVRLPTRTLRITTRKTPCGNGTNTWDTFEMKIYKRLLYLCASSEMVKKITSFTVEPGVDVSITIPDK